MLKIFMAAMLLATSGYCSADPMAAQDPLESLASDAMKFADGYLIWDNSLEAQTRTLYESLRNVTELEDDRSSLVEYRTQIYASTLNDWSKKVAEQTYGGMSHRFASHNVYCNWMLKNLFNRLPFRSQKVKAEFFITWDKEVKKNQVTLSKQIEQLKEKFWQANRRTTKTEWIASVLTGAVGAIAVANSSGSTVMGGLSGVMALMSGIAILRLLIPAKIPKRRTAKEEMAHNFNEKLLDQLKVSTNNCRRYLSRINPETMAF